MALMDKHPGWPVPDNAFAAYPRVIILSLVAAVHVAAFMILGISFRDSPVPRRAMEVVLLAAPASSQAALPRRQPSSRAAGASQKHIEEPTPEPQLVEQEARVPEVPVIDPDRPAPSVVAAPVAPPPVPEVAPDFKASYLNNRLNYPPMAQRMGIEGRVVLNVEVLADGFCGKVDIVQSSGHEVLDRAALESVKTWHFVPARHGTQAVTRWFKVPITFALKDEQA